MAAFLYFYLLDPLGPNLQYIMSELEFFMEGHVTECNQSWTLISFVIIEFWYLSL